MVIYPMHLNWWQLIQTAIIIAIAIAGQIKSNFAAF